MIEEETCETVQVPISPKILVSRIDQNYVILNLFVLKYWSVQLIFVPGLY